MRIFAISDLHLDTTNSKPMNIFGECWEGHTEQILSDFKKYNITFDDVLICAGDLSWGMKMEDAKNDLEFFNKLPTNIIVVKGNHDYWWQSLSQVRANMPENMHAIQNDAIKFGHFVFFGTRGWLLPTAGKKFSEQNQKIYDREVIRLKLSYDAAKAIAEDGDELICVMHYPPFNAKKEDNEFLKFFRENNIKTVVFGHLHGYFRGLDVKTTIDGTDFYLTSCDFLKNKMVQIK